MQESIGIMGPGAEAHTNPHWTPPEGVAPRRGNDGQGREFDDYREKDAKKFTGKLLNSTLLRATPEYIGAHMQTGSAGDFFLVGPGGLSDEASMVAHDAHEVATTGQNNGYFEAQEAANRMRSTPQLFEGDGSRTSLLNHDLDAWVSVGAGPRVGSTEDVLREPRSKVVGVNPVTGQSVTHGQAVAVLASLHGMVRSNRPRAMPSIAHSQSAATHAQSTSYDLMTGNAGTPQAQSENVEHNDLKPRMFDEPFFPLAREAVEHGTGAARPDGNYTDVENVHIGGLLYDAWHGPNADDFTRQRVHELTGLRGRDLHQYAPFSQSGSTQGSRVMGGRQFRGRSSGQIPGQWVLFP